MHSVNRTFARYKGGVMSTLHQEDRRPRTTFAPFVILAVLLTLALLTLLTTSDVAGFVLAGGGDWGG